MSSFDRVEQVAKQGTPNKINPPLNTNTPIKYDETSTTSIMKKEEFMDSVVDLLMEACLTTVKQIIF